MSEQRENVELKLIWLTFRQIKNCQHDLENSAFLQNAIDLLDQQLRNKQVKEIICLGIGRIGDCSIARHQLAFISSIGKRFDIPVVKFFDPILVQKEKEALGILNYEVLTENNEGKYSADHPTLFYLPHCPKQITNNLLYANWNPAGLQNLILICNSFKSIVDTTPERLLRPNAHFILESSALVTEKVIENSFKFTDIFNDFSIHSFDSEKLNASPSTFWNSKPEPNYSEDDLELILNGSN